MLDENRFVLPYRPTHPVGGIPLPSEKQARRLLHTFASRWTTGKGSNFPCVLALTVCLDLCLECGVSLASRAESKGYSKVR